jgi:hypothetical protein
MKRRCHLLVALLAVIVATALPALTRADWDFTLSGGQGAWSYGQYIQLGQNGFFGPYDVDLSASGNFAVLNGWVGNRDDVNRLAAGTNVAFSQTGIDTNATLGGDWVKARGKYFITTYVTSTTQGAYVAMSPGQLTTWSLQANLPIFRVSYGKQTFSPGLMLQFARTRTKEYLLFERDISIPALFGTGTRVEQAVTTRDEAEDKDQTELETWIAEQREKDPNFLPQAQGPWGKTRFISCLSSDPATLTIGLGTMPWERIIRPLAQDQNVSWNRYDINASAYQNLVGYVRYSTRNLEIGLGSIFLRTHQGPELQSTQFRRINTPTKETYTTEGWLFIRYNDGRFFLGAELDWFNRIWRFQRSLSGLYQNPDDLSPAAPIFPEFATDGSGVSRFAPQYWESWRYMLQAGVYLGPSSLRVFYSYFPGQDRRHGILIDRQPFIQEEEQAAMGLLDPYSILMSYLYGGGVNAQAYINGASVYAAKFDHMIAANLAMECSLVHARRTSDGYGLGYIRPNPGAAFFGTVDYGIRGTFLDPAPGIPDNSLGWEVMAGFVWKLVETSATANFTIEARASYWKPGGWFKYACVDRSVTGWETPTALNNWGANPNRDIAPILGFEVRLGASY